MPNKGWNEISYPFPNVNSETVEVYEWLGNFIPPIKMDVILILGLKWNHVSKKGPSGVSELSLIVNNISCTRKYSKKLEFDKVYLYFKGYNIFQYYKCYKCYSWIQLKSATIAPLGSVAIYVSWYKKGPLIWLMAH